MNANDNRAPVVKLEPAAEMTDDELAGISGGLLTIHSNQAVLGAQSAIGQTTSNLVGQMSQLTSGRIVNQP